jgi:hypothetical protein
MDPNSSYRLAVHVGAYVKINDDESHEYCEAFNIAKLLAEIAQIEMICYLTLAGY